MKNSEVGPFKGMKKRRGGPQIYENFLISRTV